MARFPGGEYPGAFYHVITRGNRREDIFSKLYKIYGKLLRI